MYLIEQKHSPTLLSLPPEILKRIATLCSWSTVLNLQLTSRRLRVLCNDRLVFKEIARFCHISEGFCQEPWSPAKLFDEQSTVATAKVAYAVEKAWKLVEVNEKAWQFESPSRICRWLPHLFSLLHPATFGLDAGLMLRLLLRTSSEWTEDRVSEHTLCDVQFCFLSKVLSMGWQPEIYLEGGNLQRIMRTGTEESDYFSQAISRFLYLKDINSETTLRRDSVQSWMSMAIAICLSSTIVRLDGHSSLPDPHVVFKQPLMETPQMFCLDTEGKFSTCHLEAMTSPEFLSDGLWTGIYLPVGEQDTINLGMYDTPMNEIKLSCYAVDDIYIAAKFRKYGRLSSEGDDRTEVQGDIYRDGRAILTVINPETGLNFSWVGRITPYGIAGWWGVHDVRHLGYFWIWKSDWCQRNEAGVHANN